MHILIVAFLRYIHKHYISNLKVKDPTGLWKTNDLAEFERAHKEMTLMIGAVSLSLQQLGILKEQIHSIETEEPASPVKKPKFIKDTGMGANQN